MGRIFSMTAPRDGKSSAAMVAEKVFAAEGVLAELRAQTGQLALDELDGEPGAAAKMAALNSKISAAQAGLQNLRQAHRLARERELRAEVAARSKIRLSQVAAFNSHSRERDAAAAELCDLAGRMQKAFQRYSAATLKMVGVRPIGTALPTMGMGPNGLCGPALGNLERLLSVEMFRCSEADASGQRYLIPFAKPLTMHDTDQQKIPPAIEMFRDAQNAILSEVKGQIERIDAEDSAKAVGEAA